MGCLRDLERADQFDPQEAKNPAWLFVRAYCQMQAGECEKGKQTYRDFVTATDQNRELPEEDIAKRAESAANGKCPSSTGKTERQQAAAMTLTRLGCKAAK